MNKNNNIVMEEITHSKTSLQVKEIQYKKVYSMRYTTSIITVESMIVDKI